MYQVYQITINDTLDNIANRFNINKEELKKLNSNTNYLPGEFIVVPYIETNYDKYIVQKGDSIYKIASYYGIDPNILILLNGLNKDDYLYPNETILIPRQGYNVFITNDNTTLYDLYQIDSIDNIIKNNSSIYLLPNQTILYEKEN